MAPTFLTLVQEQLFQVELICSSGNTGAASAIPPLGIPVGKSPLRGLADVLALNAGKAFGTELVPAKGQELSLSLPLFGCRAPSLPGLLGKS